uniref:Uncharacterized protein At4g08330ic-like n=1 Tax=Rhizophora mucronata TaxID=61149 RepID=A0A2P2JHD6_RHIMU
MRADLPKLMNSNAYHTSRRTLGVCSAGEPNFFVVSVVDILELLITLKLQLNNLCLMSQMFLRLMMFLHRGNMILKSALYNLQPLSSLAFHFMHKVLL